MPKITAEQLKEYTDFDKVKNREPIKLEMDILEAEKEVEYIAGHDFDSEEYPEIPPTVELAYLKLSQYYALINSDESLTKGIKSENISASGYSYSLGDGTTLYKPDITHLISPYIKHSEKQGDVTLKMRIL